MDYESKADELLKLGFTFVEEQLADRTMDFSHNEITVMKSIAIHSDKGETIQIGDISDSFGISRPAASQLVGRLERKGLLMRKWSKEDRRKVLVEMTDKGREVVMSLLDNLRLAVSEALKLMDEKSVDSLLSVLEMYVDAKKKYIAEHGKLAYSNIWRKN